MVLLQISWRRGSKDSRVQGFKCLFSKEFISAFNVHSISAMSFFVVPNSPLSMKLKSSVNNIYSLQFTNRTIKNVKHTYIIKGCFSLISFCNIRRNRHSRSSGLLIWEVKPYLSSLAFLSACFMADQSNP